MAKQITAKGTTELTADVGGKNGGRSQSGSRLPSSSAMDQFTRINSTRFAARGARANRPSHVTTVVSRTSANAT